jgi:rubrerythrin
LQSLGKTAENLGAAIAGETYEVEEMYPAFLAVAELQGEKAAVRSNRFAAEAEKVHAEMYAEAQASVAAQKDASVGQVYVCSVCGWTGEGEPPDECPLCKARRFIAVIRGTTRVSPTGPAGYCWSGHKRAWWGSR